MILKIISKRAHENMHFESMESKNILVTDRTIFEGLVEVVIWLKKIKY